jgi:hypothetical protein
VISQIGIAIFGVTAIYLSQHPSPRVQRYACILGLSGQVFWFYSSYTEELWGIFALSFFYTWAWFKGFRTYWLHR